MVELLAALTSASVHDTHASVTTLCTVNLHGVALQWQLGKAGDIFKKLF